MALRSVIDHPKVSELKATLKAPRYAVMGCLETLWHFTARYTPQGNIGKYTNIAIEAWLEWDGAPGALIQALIEARFLSKHPIYRLVVHDWHEHADRSIRQSLSRAKLAFCTPADGAVPPADEPPPPEPEPQPTIAHAVTR